MLKTKISKVYYLLLLLLAIATYFKATYASKVPLQVSTSMQLEWITSFLFDLLRTPAFMIALVAAIGLAAIKRPASEILASFFKVFLGIVIIMAGAITIVNAVVPLNDLFVKVGGFKGAYTWEEPTAAAAMQYLGFEIGVIFGLGFILHLLIIRFTARRTPFKYVFLTGHTMFGMAGMIALVLNNYGIRGWNAALIGSLMQAFYLTAAPAMVAPFIMPITNNQWTLGHNQDFWLTVSGIVAKYLGNPKQDVEQMKFPKGLEFLKVPSILTAIIMLPIFFIFSLLAGPSYVETKLTGGTNWLVWILLQSVMMGAGIEILLLGVRMFIGEIIPAFRGISEKLLPGAMMGLDCPTIYPFAPTALMFGVVVMLIAVLASTFIQMIIKTPFVVLPNAIYIFFVGASTGIVGNKFGGLRGLIITCLLSGFAYMFVPLLSAQFLGLGKLGMEALGMSADNGVWAIFYGLLLKVILGK
jgi:PTS system ascorbate-specific IIC component